MLCQVWHAPLYRGAIATIDEYCSAQQIERSTIQLWQVSHFGGHRFAPTLLDLPRGCYYGRLNQESLRSMLARSGDIEVLHQTYRGWSVLPAPLQALETQLIEHYGWSWLDCKVAHRITAQSSESNWIQAELAIESPNGQIQYYQAELTKNEALTIYGSCNATSPSTVVRYAVQSLRQCEPVPMQLSA